MDLEHFSGGKAKTLTFFFLIPREGTRG